MSFGFEQDYLKDLEPVLDALRERQHGEALDAIDHCKGMGATGGEILMCINATLRNVLRQSGDAELRRSIESYLTKALGY